MINISEPEKLYKNYDHAEKRSRDVHFTIDYNGCWYFHNGPSAGPIRRKKLAALFGGAGTGFMAGKGIFKDGQGVFWIKSPEGQYKIDVEDVPFIITDMDVHDPHQDNQAIDLITNFDERVEIDADNALFIKQEPLNNTDVFYVTVRDGLDARLSKSIYNELIQHYLMSKASNDEDQAQASCYVLKSRGHESTFEF